MYCKKTEDLAKATTKILANDKNFRKIILQFGSGWYDFSRGDLEKFTFAMETSSVTNLQLGISLRPDAPIEKYHPFIKRIVQCHSIHYLILKWYSNSGTFPIDHFDSIVEALSRNSAIQNLQIFFSPHHFERDAAASIAKSLRYKNSFLKSLNLRNTRIGVEGCGAVLEALHNYPPLKALNMSNCSIGTEEAKSIGQLIRSVQYAIEELEISGNHIGDEGGAAVMAGLLENSSIRVLGMGGCEIGKEGAESIANALCSGKCTIEEIDLNRNFGMGDEGCFVIMESLKNNNSICKLNLSACGIGDVGMSAIANVLQNNHAICLKSLSLRSNENIGLEGFKALTIALSQNSSLEDLDLSCCNVNDGGCIDLMNALCQNSSLKVLTVECCQIGNEGGKAVANFLKSNVGPIHDLNLKENSFDEESLLEIAHALPFNTHLTMLSLFYGSKLTKKVCIAFDDATFRNHSLRGLDTYGRKFKDFKKSIQKNLAVNMKLGPLKAEMVKTGLFPHRILPCLMTASCFIDALSKATSLDHLSPVFDLVCEQPIFFDIDDCVGERQKAIIDFCF